MNNALLKFKVREYRKKGYTFSEIYKKLRIKIPKSTMSIWCKNIKLSKKYKQKITLLNKINLQKGRILARIINKEKRDKYLGVLMKKNTYLLDKINIDVQKLLLCVLYLAEGGKHKSSRQLKLGNSDPRIISFYIKLLKNCYNIQNKKMRARIQCRYDQNTDELERFWQKIININIGQFYPTYKDKRTEGKITTKKDYKGVCVIYYFDTSIQLELELLADKVIRYIIEGP